MVGEHIRVLKAGRWVHAVDCGDETVLHLVEEAPPPRVRRAYRPEFVAGAAAVEVVLHRERTFAASEIVKRAYSRASDPALAAMFRDSEAFAEWCTTGRLPSAPPNVAISVPGVARAGVPAAAGEAAPAAKAKAAPAPKVKVSAKAKEARGTSPARKPKPAVRAKPAAKAARARRPARGGAAKRTAKPRAAKRRARR